MMKACIPPFVASITSSGLKCAAVLATAAIIPLLAPSPAKAFIAGGELSTDLDSDGRQVIEGASVDGRLWNISAVVGTFGDGTNVGGVDLTNNNAGLFRAGAPWWGDEVLADKFAGMVAGILGTGGNLTGPFPNKGGRSFFIPDPFCDERFDGSCGTSVTGEFGPLFAFTATKLQPGAVVLGRTAALSLQGRNFAAVNVTEQRLIDQKAVFMTATEVPGPLPILGAAAAFGYSRKLRKRINRSTNADATTAGA